MYRYNLPTRDREVSQWFVKSYSYIPQQKLAAQTTFSNGGKGEVTCALRNNIQLVRNLKSITSKLVGVFVVS